MGAATWYILAGVVILLVLVAFFGGGGEQSAARRAGVLLRQADHRDVILSEIGVVVGAIFTAKRGANQSSADSKFTEYGCNLKPSVGPNCTIARQKEIDALDQQAATAGTVGVIGFVAGGVLLAGGATALVLGLKKSKADEKPKTVWVTPWVSPTGFGVNGTF